MKQKIIKRTFFPNCSLRVVKRELDEYEFYYLSFAIKHRVIKTYEFGNEQAAILMYNSFLDLLLKHIESFIRQNF